MRTRLAAQLLATSSKRGVVPGEFFSGDEHDTAEGLPWFIQTSNLAAIEMRRKRKPLNDPSVGKEDKYQYIGTHVQKWFEGYGLFKGQITSYDPLEDLWMVVYEDGDREELALDGVLEGMQGTPQPACQPPKQPKPQKQQKLKSLQENEGDTVRAEAISPASRKASACKTEKSGPVRRCVPASCPFYKQLIQEQSLLLETQHRCKELTEAQKRKGHPEKCKCQLVSFGDQAVLVERREHAEPIIRNIQVTVTSDCQSECDRQKAVTKELKRLSTHNSLSGPLRSSSVAPEVVSPLVFESIPGLFLFQGLLHTSASNGVRLLEEIKHDSQDLSDLVNGKYRRYACSNSENDTNQLRVYFASDATRSDDRTCQEIRRGAPPEVSMPEWTKKLHELIQKSVFPFLREDLRKMEEEERAAIIEACRAKHKAIPHQVMKPTDLGDQDPSMFHHTMVHYRGNLGSHFDPVWLGHIIIASSLEPADIVMVHPVRNISQRLRLFAGDVYVLMGEARDEWAHEVQLWGESEQRSSVVSRYWRPGHAFQERKFDNIQNTYWKDLRGAGHGDLR